MPNYTTVSAALIPPGATATGDFTVVGDLTVQGTTTSVVNTTTSGIVTIDVDNIEALLVRKDGDLGDVLAVDTVGGFVHAKDAGFKFPDDTTQASAATGTGVPVADTTALVKGSVDATKLVRIEADGLTTGTTRIITMPDQNIDLTPGTDFAAFSHTHAASDVTSGTFADVRIAESNVTQHFPIVDTTGLVKGSVDATKIVRIEADGLTTATTRVITMPDSNLTLMGGFTQGSVVFAGSAGNPAQNNANLFWNNTTKRAGFGTNTPNAPVDITGVTPGSVGGFQSGSLHITSSSALVNANAVITGHNLFGGNKQLWYLGSASSSNDNVLIINRQTGSISVVNSASQGVTIDSSGNATISVQLNVDNLRLDGNTVSTTAGDLTLNPTDSLIVNSTLNAATGNEVALSLNYTVNKATSGNDTGLVINQTDTASPGTSLLLDLQQGGTTRFSVDAGGNVNIGAAVADELFHVAKAVDGIFVGLLIENSQANSASSTNETVELRFGFGGNNDVARISVTKKGDYTVLANEKSALRLCVDIAGTLTQVVSVVNSGLSLSVPASKIDFSGDAGGGDQGIRYKDAGGTIRSALAFPGSDLVVLSNQAANGTVEVRANTSTAGSGGEVTVATFADTEITATVPVIATNLKAHALVENRSPTASTSSTSFVTLESASAVTFSGRPLLCFVNVAMFPSVLSLTVELAIQIDSGSDVVVAQRLLDETGGGHNTVSGAIIVTPTAGSHTLRVRWRISGGSGTLTLDANDQILLHAVEL